MDKVVDPGGLVIFRGGLAVKTIDLEEPDDFTMGFGVTRDGPEDGFMMGTEGVVGGFDTFNPIIGAFEDFVGAGKRDDDLDKTGEDSGLLNGSES
mgnify:CR=1 FL=1